MWDIHQSASRWLARRTMRSSTTPSAHRSHRRRFTLELLEGRTLLSATTWTVSSVGDSGTGSGHSGDLRYCITQADQTPGDNNINFAVTGTINLSQGQLELKDTSLDSHGGGIT